MSRRSGLALARALLAGGGRISGVATVTVGANAATGSRFMSAAPINSKDGKVLHPDLLNDNLKKTQARRAEITVEECHGIFPEA